MINIYNNILETIGKTQVVRINKLTSSGVNIYAKVESFNPKGSVKERLAIGVIEDAERRGELKPGQTIVEATSGIPQIKDSDGNHSGRHPNFRPHIIQGWLLGFIPKLTESTVTDILIDGYMAVDGNHAIKCSKDLAQQEGLFVGITAGATFSAALKIAEKAPAGSNILCMLPDTGERYLTTTLFEDVAIEMTEEVQNIAKTTKGYRFDVTTPVAVEEVIPTTKIKAVKELNEIIINDETPIVMFALEWCEFC